jgi:hypothetical protein
VLALTGIVHLLAGFELTDRSGRRWLPECRWESSRLGSGRRRS